MWFFKKKTPNNSAAAQAIIPQTMVIRGRQFAPDAPYALPKDWKEDQRLDMQHFMFRKYMRGNFMAPITNPRSILDVACGTGRWGAEMARQFPHANVFGVDIKCPDENGPAIIGPDLKKPDNYSVMQGDITQGVLNNWENLFDFVHMRLVVVALPSSQWDTAIESIIAMTTPGGWIELVDGIVSPIPGDSQAMQKLFQWNYQIFTKRGFDLRAGEHLGERMQRAGLKNIHFYRIDVPIGYAAGEDGSMMAADIEAVARATKPLCVHNNIVSSEDYDAALEQYHQDLVRARGQFYPQFVAYGQKI